MYIDRDAITQRGRIVLVLSFLFLFTGESAFCQQPPFTPSRFPELDGFPVFLGEGIPANSSVNVGDIEGDGDLEICFGTGGGYLYVYHHTGVMVDNWPVQTHAWMYGTPALADLDNDGDLEITIANDTSLYVWHHDATVADGFPVTLTCGVEAQHTPAVGDLDGDGDLEIIHGAYEHPCLVFAWHHDGTLVEGWPVTIPPGGPYDHCDNSSAPALGDLDRDGTLEVIVATDGGQVYVLDHDGTDFPGWPKEDLDQFGLVSPVIGDIDGDGEVEIVVGSDFSAVIYAWDAYGNDKPGWPWDAGWQHLVVGVVLADVAGDSALEVIVNATYPYSVNIDVVDGSTGTELPGWPQPDSMEVRGGDPVVVSDIDSDGEKEIVMAAYDDCFNFACQGYILAYNGDGTMVEGFPISLGYELSATSPCIVDLDQDGDLEICTVTDWAFIFSGDCYLHAWDLPDPIIEDQGDWRFFGHDPFHTNHHGYLLPTENPIDVDLSPDTLTVSRGGSFDLAATFTNRNVLYQSFDTALFLRLPGGQPYSGNPLYGPFSLSLELLSDLQVNRTMTVPSGAPLGDYRLLLPAGTSVHNIMDMDSTIVHVIE